MNAVGMLDNVIGCVVAFIPEGMPIGVSLTQWMKSNNILPKRLSTVQTLDCVNALYSNKRGTLTEDRVVATTVGFVDRCMTIDEVFSVLYGGGGHARRASPYFGPLQQCEV